MDLSIAGYTCTNSRTLSSTTKTKSKMPATIRTEINKGDYTANFKSPAKTAVAYCASSPFTDPAGYVTLLGQRVYL